MRAEPLDTRAEGAALVGHKHIGEAVREVKLGGKLKEMIKLFESYAVLQRDVVGFGRKPLKAPSVEVFFADVGLDSEANPTHHVHPGVAPPLRFVLEHER